MQSMNLTKLSAAIILALSTAACSSGGSHSTTSTSPVITEQTAAEKAAAEKAAAEKAAAEKAAAEKAAAEKAAAEKAAAEKAAAEKAAAEKAAAEKAAAEKAAAEKAAAEKAAAEKAAAEKAAAEKAAAEKAAAEKAAAEKAAAEKAAAIEANRLVLLNKAKEAGLNDQQAAAYAEDNKEADEMSAQTALESILVESERIALDEALYQAKDKYHNNNAYPIGQITAKKLSHSDVTTNGDRTILIKHEVVYNQPYSVVIGDYSSWTNGVGSYIFKSGMNSSITANGLKTEVNAIPSLGSANYSGKAFSSEENPIFASTSGLYKEGLLSYDVNFTDKIGVGLITGLGDIINLEKGSISGTGISAIAKQSSNNGTYSLDFYGKKAEEIAGKVIFNGKDTVGFGGTRGEITK